MDIAKTPTWKKLESRWKNGFETLLPEEQETIALWWLEAETFNGTLDQFFHNSSGDLALLAEAGLKRLNLPITLGALQRAMALFGEDYPVEGDQRHPRLKQLRQEYGDDLFEPETEVIVELPEAFIEIAVEALQALYTSRGL